VADQGGGMSVLHRRSSCSLARAMDSSMMYHGIFVSCQSAATLKIVKALLVMSLSHVSSAIASTRPLPLSLCSIVITPPTPVVAGPRLWNTLLAELRQPDVELVTFRRLLETYFLNVTRVHSDFRFNCAI